MKFLIFALIIFGSTAQADQWPYDPICRRFNATSETVQILGLDHKIVLCKFGLSSYLDKDSLPFGIGDMEKMAVRSYRENGQFPMGRHCSEYGAKIRRAIGSNGQRFDLCYFFDHSVMEEQTFSEGPQSGLNWEMNSALGIH